DNDETTRPFGSRFFGVDPTKVTLVGESYVSREWPKNRYQPPGPCGDGVERLNRILQAVSDPPDIGKLKGAVGELTGQAFDPGDDWRRSLFENLLTNEYVFHSTE